MALAIDASTPAFKAITGTASSITTASFTPPAGSLLVIGYCNSDHANAVTSFTDSLGSHLTYTKRAAETANLCDSEIWIAPVVTSAPMTVTANSVSDTGQKCLGVVVVTGAVATQNGATGVNTSTSGTPSKGITTVGANSLVLGAVANFANATAGTPGTGQSLSFNGLTFSNSDSGDGSASWMQYLTGMNLAAGATATINDTAPTGIQYSMAVVEILAAADGGGGATRPARIVTWPQAMFRSAYR